MLNRILLSLSLGIAVFAQDYAGSISGRVSDTTGLPVPKAVVAVTEQSTNTTVRTVTGETGDYSVPYLKPGTYRVSFKASGFKETVETGVQIQINQARRVDPRLEIGQVTEAVEVSASYNQINYVSPEIGQVVDDVQLTSLPEQATSGRGRSPFLLAKLLPGVTTNGNAFTNINGFSFSGGRRVTNEILVDGLPTTNPSDETYTLTPSPDSIQEFKVLTTPFSAEYGHTGGGVMIATTKAGTNELHGRVYNLFRNRVLNGRDTFAAARSQTKYVQNDPGFTVGGPAYISHFYDGRNKTFFLVDFNVTLASQGGAYSGLVPTALERQGDFSQTFAGGKLVQIFDPSTAHLGPDGKTYVRNPFPGNVIPSARIDPVAAQVVKFYPDPNAAVAAGNYFVAPSATNDNWQSLGRIDQNFGEKDRSFFRFGQYSPNNNAALNIPNKANNATYGGWVDTQAVLSETHIVGPNVVNDFRFGWVQEDNYTTAGGSAVPELGLKGVALTSFPTIQVSQMIQSTTSGMVQLGSNASNHDRDRSWVFNEALSWQRGKHSIKIGGDFRRQMYNNYSPGKLSGSYVFSNTFSAGAQNDTSTGFALADLLLGAPTSTNISINDYTFRMNINSAGAFFEDHFKILPDLTLDLGVRWEFDGPYSEANNQYYNFNPSIVNRTTGNFGDVQFAGQNGAPTHFTPNIYHDFLPRVGFSWSFAPHTVLRGGYGIYRLPNIGYWGVGAASKYASAGTFTSLDQNVTPAFYLKDGVPPISYNVDANGNPNLPASLNRPTSSVTELDTRTRTPYNQTWQIGFQREFSGNWLAELDYVGTRGVKLQISIPENQLPFNQWGAPQSARPFPQYLNVSKLADDGNSFYNSLQASLQRRWKNGVLSLAYTWAKVTDDVDGTAYGTPIQDVYNLRNEHGIAANNVPHRFVANYVYRLPFRTGVPGVREIIRGWEVSGITEFQRGLPLSATQSNNTGGFTATQRSNLVADPALSGSDRSLSRWFNPAAFAVASARTAGNAARYVFYGPGINNWDLAVMRNIKLLERVNLQIRGEFYDAFNHPNYKNPNTTLGNANFGKITSDNSPRITELMLRLFF